jgi:hypothetical protein
VNTTTTGLVDDNHHRRLIAVSSKTIRREIENTPWYLCANSSSLSSPVSNTRPPAIGISVQSLTTVKEALVDYKKITYHITWTRSFRGTSCRSCSWTKRRTVLKAETSPGSKPLGSCRIRSWFCSVVTDWSPTLQSSTCSESGPG